jgi:hypothetical protein
MCSHHHGIVAQHPAEYASLDVLDDHDRMIIRHEYENKWSHPWPLYTTIIMCSIAAITQQVFMLINEERI